MTESEAYFILNLLNGIGPVRAKRLRERFGSLDLALTARGADLRSVKGIGPELVEKLVSWKETTDHEKERKWAEELGLTIITPGGCGLSDEPQRNLRPAAGSLY